MPQLFFFTFLISIYHVICALVHCLSVDKKYLWPVRTPLCQSPEVSLVISGPVPACLLVVEMGCVRSYVTFSVLCVFLVTTCFQSAVALLTSVS